MPGWKFRIGYLSPSVIEIPSDWNLILPSGVTIVGSGLNVQAHTEKEFEKAIQTLESALSVFLAEEVDAALLGGIALGLQRGYEGEAKIVTSLAERLNFPFTTVLRANVRALEFFKAKKIVIATAYTEKTNQAFKQYFEEAGLQVMGIQGYGISRPVEQVKLPEGASAEVARAVYSAHPQAEAILIHGRWRHVAEVEKLETDLGRPVISSNAASLWWVLQSLGKRLPVIGYGKLLRQEVLKETKANGGI